MLTTMFDEYYDYDMILQENVKTFAKHILLVTAETTLTVYRKRTYIFDENQLWQSLDIAFELWVPCSKIKFWYR